MQTSCFSLLFLKPCLVLITLTVTGPHRLLMLVNIFVAIPIFVLPNVMNEFLHAAVTVFFVGVGVGSSIVIRFVQAKRIVTPAFVADNVRFVVLAGGTGMTTGAVLSGNKLKFSFLIILVKLSFEEPE